MKDTRITFKTAVSIVLCICAVLAATGILLSASGSDLENGIIREIGNFFDLKIEDEISKPFFTPDSSSFTIPALPAYSPKEVEEAPALRTMHDPGFSLSSKYQTSDFYQGKVNYVDINIKNEGNTPIFIKKFGISISSSEKQIYSQDCGVLLSQGEEQDLGVIGALMPEGKEKVNLSIVLWILAENSEGEWYEYQPQFLEEFSEDLKSLPEKTNPPYKYNPSYAYKTLNKLVEPSDPAIREAAAEIAKTEPGTYNIYQICALFDKVRKDINYVSDPRGSDIWEPANSTLKIGAGDCEDQAILLSSLIEAIGGTTRIYLTDTHAFAAVYIGNETSTREAVINGIRAYYGDVDVHYITDEYGSWLMLDPTSSFYAGGLPGTTAPTASPTENPIEENKETYGSWTFINTSEVAVIDINPES
jgi:transglutaminase-like putative cysteine protease